jgi:hypothetical protein
MTLKSEEIEVSDSLGGVLIDEKFPVPSFDPPPFLPVSDPVS